MVFIRDGIFCRKTCCRAQRLILMWQEPGTTLKMTDNAKSCEIHEYAEALYSTDSFQDAFSLLEQQALNCGFHGVLYTYIPKLLIESNFAVEPVYELSENYAPRYLEHYAEARFDRHDPLIEAVMDGVKDPINWWGNVCGEYMDKNQQSREVISVSKDYGISNGVTVPLMSGELGLAGASFITDESRSFDTILSSELDRLALSTKLFHGLVSMNAGHTGRFARTLLNQLNTTEKKFLIELARGKVPCQIAADMKKTEGYLEQVMLKIRRKLSGVGKHEPPKINRNQLLYYAGLLNILEHAS